MRHISEQQFKEIAQQYLADNKVGNYKSSVFAPTLLERIQIWLYVNFPERELYVRSDGRVQYFKFDTGLQARVTFLSVIFLGWVAYATANVLFGAMYVAKGGFNSRPLTHYLKQDVPTAGDDLQAIIRQFSATEKGAVICLKNLCDLRSKQQILDEFAVEDRALKKIEVTHSRASISHLAKQKKKHPVLPKIYVWTKSILDFGYRQYTGKSSYTLSDDTAFQIVFGMVWATSWGLLVALSTFMVRGLLRFTRRQFNPNVFPT